MASVSLLLLRSRRSFLTVIPELIDVVMPEISVKPEDPDKPDNLDKLDNPNNANNANNANKPNDPDKPNDLDFGRKSKIWDLYLEDAEQAAKAKVELMKSGLLDSVLLFVRGQHILGVSMVVVWLIFWAGWFIRWGGFFFRH
jgi:hypothetical protein